MNRIDQLFQRLRAENKKALAAFYTAGFPDAPGSLRLIFDALDAGADLIELGVPFSDPSADGPAIQAASQKALANGTTLPDVLQTARAIRARNATAPLILFTYFNPLFQHGLARVAREAKDAGVDAFLVVDLPFEESEEFAQFLRPEGLVLIPLVSPATSRRRAGEILKNAGGFVYYVSVKGVTGGTGGRDDFAEVGARVAEVRTVTSLPVLAGFGISTPEDAARMGRVADGIVVGSAFMRLAERYGGEELFARNATLVRGLKGAVA
ncbi:MAG: tryptophan synthase subunit alpha [Opitutaceae bacterium]|jgi:tryptophan synthase alpha chain|nr:tryptophan synthase subunit alpha [Opitutaceae bacterium]